MSIQWEESYTIGVPIIDEQHKEIFSKFDQLTQALEDGTVPVDIVNLVGYLSEFAASHFADEENLMKLYKYPGLEEQIQHHVQFKDNIKNLSQMLTDNVSAKEVAIKANATIIRYFINHVRKLDSKMATYINSVKSEELKI